MRTPCFSSFLVLLELGFGEARRKWSLTVPAKVHHLVVLQHGLGGNASDWSFFAETLQRLNTGDEWRRYQWSGGSKNKPAKKNVQVTFWAPSYNSEEGIDVVGKQLADDILKKQEEYAKNGEPVRYLSAIGHSMGGLFLRYAFKSLYELGAFGVDGKSISWFPSVKMELRNFFTVASPHLSVWRPNDDLAGFLFNLVTTTSPERSTKQVSLNDAKFRAGSESARQPLLYRMAREEAFTKPLSAFKRGVLYSNVFGDTQVWYESGAIRAYNPFKGRGKVELKKSAPFPHIVDIGCGRHNHSEVQRPYWTRKHTGRLGKAVGQMYRSLNNIAFGDVGWERCDVNIDGSLAMHFNHWLILGIEKGIWKVEDPAMHVMSNLIEGDETIKDSKHRFKVILEARKEPVDSMDSS